MRTHTAGTGQQQIAEDLHADTGADRPDEKRGQHGSHEESLYHDDGLSAVQNLARDTLSRCVGGLDGPLVSVGEVEADGVALGVENRQGHALVFHGLGGHAQQAVEA